MLGPDSKAKTLKCWSRHWKEDITDGLLLFFVFGKVRGDCPVKIRIMFPSAQESSYRPLGSVCFDHVGVQRMTVDAH